MKPLFEYNDFRTFLADYYQFNKLTRKGFSYRSFLGKAGIKGPSFLKEVIEAKKNLTSSSIRKLAKALELSKEETGYFRLLVLFNQAEKHAEKQRFFQKLSSFPTTTDIHAIKKDQFEYFSRWYNLAVREYIHAHPFFDDYKSLAGALLPKITTSQAQRAVELLKRLGLIKLGDNGRYCVTDPIITFDAETRNIAAHNLHKSMQAINARALDAVPKEQRYFRTILGSFSEAAFQRIRLELDGSRKRILDIINSDTDEKKVYAVGMQLYQMEKRKK
jgi:uncharacterized protein (TIGR02147 family)